MTYVARFHRLRPKVYVSKYILFHAPKIVLKIDFVYEIPKAKHWRQYHLFDSNMFFHSIFVICYIHYLSPLYYGIPLTYPLANSECPDEMQHNAAFHQDLQFLLRSKVFSGTEMHPNLEIQTCDPLKYIGQSHPYCIYMNRRIHWDTMG